MQRRRLLLAMVEVLAEHGFENTSVGRVCKRAGVSRRTFYELFDDRDECLLAAFDAAVERLSRPVLAAWETDGGWLERTRGALAVLLEQLEADLDVARLCLVETLKGGQAIAARRAQVVQALVDAIEQGRLESRRSSEPPPLSGQGVVGGALSVIHARLVQSVTAGGPLALSDLTGALMAMIVHPYLGAAAARRELDRPVRKPSATNASTAKDPFKDLSIRFTYRTARVLATIAAEGGRGSYPSNRAIADSSGVADEGQISRLLTRLQRSGLIENRAYGWAKGERNAWALTERGEAVQEALAG
jgi:AcrR family transcriptional regulator